MGDVRKTVQNLSILQILPEENVILVAGSIPGGKNGYVMIKNATKKIGAVKVNGAGEVQEKSKNPMKASKAGVGAAKPAKK